MTGRGVAAEADLDAGVPLRERLSTATAYGLACLLHALTVSSLICGVLLVLRLEAVVQPLIGLVLILCAVLLRPRLGGLDPDLPTLPREEAPALYALLDDVADAVGVRRLDVVQVGTDFSVRVTTFGVRRRRRLVLGYPLWLTSAPQQRVAALAHELGHFASRDVRRGALVGLALASLAGGAEEMEHRTAVTEAAFDTSPLSRYADEMAVAAARFKAHGRTVNWVLWIPGLLMKGAARLLARLTLPSARRAEFQADAVAARVASTRAAVSALHDRRLGDVVTIEVHRLAVAVRTLGRTGSARRVDQDFWAKVGAHAASSRGSTRNDPDRVGAGDGTPADSDPLGRQDKDPGLPAIGLRATRLSTKAAYPATVLLDAARADAIEDELRDAKRLLARKIVQDCVQA
ncbi:M48 family metalloprotease [Streptomyces triticiradicis]|uniref:M48 family metalloprotease n=1 Tax=Streptomyces triticiradicis TaxID=2651189 RepID=A0A7J5D6U4_9ACTN|nr:M48 family metalloprotease [Streptomyces triticiradicis]